MLLIIRGGPTYQLRAESIPVVELLKDGVFDRQYAKSVGHHTCKFNREYFDYYARQGRGVKWFLADFSFIQPGQPRIESPHSIGHTDYDKFMDTLERVLTGRGIEWSIEGHEIEEPSCADS